VVLKQEGEMTVAFWLDYLKKHPGTSEISNLLYDCIIYSTRDQGITHIHDVLVAYSIRTMELNERNQTRRDYD